MSENKSILFFPLLGHGNINACHGLAEVLQQRGHRIVFAVNNRWKGMLAKYGFEEQILITENNNKMNEFIKQNESVMSLPAIEKVGKFYSTAFTVMLETHKSLEKQYENIIDEVKPDIIVIDHLICSPVLTNCGIPWIWFFSAGPLCCIADDRTPPARSGLPTNGDKVDWKLFQDKWDDIMSQFWVEVNEYNISRKGLKLPVNKLHPESPFLNIYMFPEELDYLDIRPLPENWNRLDFSMRTVSEEFSINDSFNQKPGKLIYFSMGSIACADLKLMTRLVTILAKSPNKLIISKGILGNQYELPDNMWGENLLPQTKIIPLVDLVITHSGNNTVCESFYFGKPLIVLPVFGDQFDIAQRITEKGFGVRLDPYHCSEKDLLENVETLLYDHSLKEKLQIISKRIQSSNSREKIVKLIESLLSIY